MSNQRLSGKCLWFNERYGNGVVEDADGNEYYTDISVTPNRLPLKRGQHISFELNPNIKDCNCAWKVEVTSDQQY